MFYCLIVILTFVGGTSIWNQTRGSFCGEEIGIYFSTLFHFCRVMAKLGRFGLLNRMVDNSNSNNNKIGCLLNSDLHSDDKIGTKMSIKIWFKYDLVPSFSPSWFNRLSIVYYTITSWKRERLEHLLQNYLSKLWNVRSHLSKDKR